MRQTMLDLMMYSEGSYKRDLFALLRQSLRRLAQDGGGGMPLCVVSHGFGSVLAIDFFTHLQQGLDAAEGDDGGGDATPLERGQTLAAFFTLGSPRPLLVTPSPSGGLTKEAASSQLQQLQVPAPAMLSRWPHLRGGWINFFHRADCLGYALQAAYPTVGSEFECRQRHKGDLPIQSGYFVDLVDCVGRIAQSISWVWQDTNRSTTNTRAESKRE